MLARPDPPSACWDDAVFAAALIAVDPRLGGIHLRARAGPVRDRWLEALSAQLGEAVPVRRIAAGIDEARLSGGLDIARTVEAGRPVVERGVLASADGGVILLAMAERLPPGAAALIGMALDCGEIRVERDGVSERHRSIFCLVALDEGAEDDEALPAALADRLGLRLDLNAIRLCETRSTSDPGPIAEAKALLATVTIGAGMVEALCTVALGVGHHSLRASLHLVRAACAAAALRDRAVVATQDAAMALRLVLGLRPTPAAPEPEGGEADRPAEEQQSGATEPSEPEAPAAATLEDILVHSVEASLPENLLGKFEAATVRKAGRGPSGRVGQTRNRGRRGRVIGMSDRPPAPGVRISILATLRQAAPFQRIRLGAAVLLGAPARQGLIVRKSDFRYPRFREKIGTTAIFAVDASGSAAFERLAETKGAIELLLAECYVRRDQVALVAFRGKSAETLLEPTRSLVRAKRSLTALPGGGGTPLAEAIVATHTMAESISRRGQSVVAVFLTDGRGNVGFDGALGLERVEADTATAARLFAAAGIRSTLIDTGRRPQPRAEALARALGAEYLALPRGGSRSIARAIGTRMED